MEARVIEITEEKIRMVVRVICYGFVGLDSFSVLSYDCKINNLAERCEDAVSSLFDEDECDDEVTQIIYDEVKDVVDEYDNWW